MLTAPGEDLDGDFAEAVMLRKACWVRISVGFKSGSTFQNTDLHLQPFFA